MHRFLAGILVLILTACGKGGTATPDLEPAALYRTGTPSQTPTVLPILTEIRLPGPTTFVYVVVSGDTLGRIAGRYGITLEALMNANPGVQPTALSVGTELIIPGGDEVPGVPTPTPAQPSVQQARCWPEAGGGCWCFTLVRNDYAQTLENLSARFTLLDSAGQETAGQTVFALLDILPPGQSLPLAAHFPAPLPAEAGVRVQVLTSIRLLAGDTRYLPASVENTLVRVEAGGRTAQVSGRVVLNEAGTANTVWVLASAYDASGNVVGVRRWESSAALTADAPLAFDFLVSSMGPEIEGVEFLVEARP